MVQLGSHLLVRLHRRDTLLAYSSIHGLLQGTQLFLPGKTGSAGAERVKKRARKSVAHEQLRAELSLPNRPRRQGQVAAFKARELSSVTLSLDAKAVNVAELSQLLAATGQNGELLAARAVDGSVVPANLEKLERALANSMLVVSIHVRDPLESAASNSASPSVDFHARVDDKKRRQNEPRHPIGHPRRWLDMWLEQRSGPERLVAFGRVYSDTTLTAAIHDLVVDPLYEGHGLRSKVLQRILRELNRRGIRDISLLPSTSQRQLYTKEGFRDDVTGAVTMMYTRRVLQPTPSHEDRGTLSARGGGSLLMPSGITAPMRLRRTLGEPKKKERSPSTSVQRSTSL